MWVCEGCSNCVQLWDEAERREEPSKDSQEPVSLLAAIPSLYALQDLEGAASLTPGPSRSLHFEAIPLSLTLAARPGGRVGISSAPNVYRNANC